MTRPVRKGPGIIATHLVSSVRSPYSKMSPWETRFDIAKTILNGDIPQFLWLLCVISCSNQLQETTRNRAQKKQDGNNISNSQIIHNLNLMHDLHSMNDPVVIIPFLGLSVVAPGAECQWIIMSLGIFYVFPSSWFCISFNRPFMDLIDCNH